MNHSQFFLPNTQATSRVIVSSPQPLTGRKRQAYNTGLTVLANIDKYFARNEWHRQLQTHLLEMTRADWAMRQEQGVLITKKNS